MPTISRTYAARDFKLILAGVDVGLVKSVEGGAITADVIAESVVNGVRPKHLGPARIEPFTIECDLPLDPAVSGWIAQSWANSANLQDGAIVELDDRFAVHSVRRFQGARVLETTISAVDAAVATKEAGSLTIQFQPQAIEFTKDADVIRGTTLHKPHKSIPWSKRNFRLEIAGLDCTKVSTMDSFTIKQMATELSTDFPHLKITLAEGTAQTWIDWHENLVIAGNSSDERNGALIFLSPNMLTEFGRINFFNLGIFKILPDKEDGRSDKVRQVTAELYCERMEFQLGAANASHADPSERQDTGAGNERAKMYDKTVRMLKPALERVAADPQFRARLELQPLEALAELGVNLDPETQGELAGKRFSEFWAARRKAVEGPVEVRDLPPEEDLEGFDVTRRLNVLNKRPDVTFAPPYVPVGPVK